MLLSCKICGKPFASMKDIKTITETTGEHAAGDLFCKEHPVPGNTVLLVQPESLTLLRLSLTNAIRCTDAFHPIKDWSPTDWATAMGGECGEALNKVKKLRRLDGADKNVDTPAERERITAMIMEEIADTIIYADLLATRLGGNLEKAIIEKFNKVSDERGSNIKL